MTTPTIATVKAEFKRQAEEAGCEIIGEQAVKVVDIVVVEGVTAERIKTGETYVITGKVKHPYTGKSVTVRGKTVQLSGDWLLEIKFPK